MKNEMKIAYHGELFFLASYIFLNFHLCSLISVKVKRQLIKYSCIVYLYIMSSEDSLLIFYLRRFSALCGKWFCMQEMGWKHTRVEKIFPIQNISNYRAYFIFFNNDRMSSLNAVIILSWISIPYMFFYE